MYETFYEPTTEDLRDYAQHCKEEDNAKVQVDSGNRS